MEWIYNKSTYHWVAKTPLANLIAKRVYSVWQSGTRGKPTGYARTQYDRQTKIQHRGYAMKPGEFAVQVIFHGNSAWFYGNTLESAQRKALNFYRRTLRESYEQANGIAIAG